MKAAQYNQIITNLEAQASSVKWDFQISDLIGEILELHKEGLSSKQKQKMMWELLLFRLRTKNRFANDGLKTKRFVPMVTYEDGSVFPNPDDFPEEAISHFKSRVNTSNSSIFKARFLDFLWETSKSKDKHLFASAAIEQYLLTVDDYCNENAISERLDGLQRATELALILERKKDLKPLTNKVVEKLNVQIDETVKSGKYRWLLEMFELAVVVPDSFSPSRFKQFISMCMKAADGYHSDQNFHLQRSFLALKIELTKIIDSSAETRKIIDKEIGQSYIDEAEAKSESGLVKAHFLHEAIEHFKKLGDMKKVDELIAEVKTATKEVVDNKEFKQFSSEVELKKGDLEKIRKTLGTGEDVPENMGIQPLFFPDWDHATKMTEEHSKKFVFMHLANPVIYSDKYPISVPQTPERQREDQVMLNYKIEISLAHDWLTGSLEELIKEKKLSVSDFRKFLLKLKDIDEDTYETVWIGIESYFEGDYFHSVHVLTTQLEDMLRKLLNLFGGQTTTQHIQGNAFTEKNLNRILIDLKPYVPERLSRYISWVLDDYRGYNLRYKVGHGFFKKKNAHPVYATALLHIICLLIANTKISAKKK